MTTDQAVSNATQADPVIADAVHEQIAETGAESTPVENKAQEPVKTEDVPFPKKAVNAISRRDKQIKKMRDEMAAYKAELERFRQSQTSQPKVDDAPKEESFNNYGDFLEAKILHKLQKEAAGKNEAQQKQQPEVSYEAQMWVEERRESVQEKASEYMQSIPDYKDVFMEYGSIADELPEHVQMAFLEADDAPLAFYNLAKEGRLESLATMSPYKAAMEIARAQKPVGAPKQTISKAPAPISSAKGVSGGRSDDELSGRELLKKHKLI